MTRTFNNSHGIQSAAYLKIVVTISIILFAVNLTDTLVPTQHYRPCNRSWDGAKGICIPLRECPNLSPEGTSRIRWPDLCENEGPMPVVCCVPKNESSAKGTVQALSLSSAIRDVPSHKKPLWLQKCMEYAKLVYENDDGNLKSESKSTQCVKSDDERGGRAKFGEFPHMAAVGYEVDAAILFQCGGSLISERYVLTGARCIYGSGRPRWVLLGQVSWRETKIKYDQMIKYSSKIEIPELFEVSQLIVHPDYKRNVLYFDVGLLQLSRSPRLGHYLRPACLPSSRPTSDLDLTGAGWGARDFVIRGTYDLRKGSLREVPYNECKKSFASYFKYSTPSGMHRESMMCAGRPISKVDSCQGDNGGPLQANHPDLYCTYEVVGVFSYGNDCGFRKPALYSRVEFFRSWIEDIVWN